MTSHRLFHNPRRTQFRWGLAPKNSAFPQGIWQDDSNRIGNLLLVSGRTNTKMARKPFLEKVGYIGETCASSWIWAQDTLNEQDWNLELVQACEQRMLVSLRAASDFRSEYTALWREISNDGSKPKTDIHCVKY
ncbi:DUF1524 domain-containing protein [uncultured Ruegeria sp.]|uniref:GmrSD restriction endonuclease domain-containing protein n=1 Tax=uncultured Ruegeria sp. TaxID=259304 RepID=UPI00345719CB